MLQTLNLLLNFFTKKASEILSSLRIPNLVDKIEEACRGSILGILPQILTHLPKRQFLSRDIRMSKNTTFSVLRPYAEDKSDLDSMKEYPPLELTQRFYHIIGIDILLDSDGNPQVLEINDRPSLHVTVPFERELKETLVRDVFQHVCSNGEILDDTPSSGWKTIYPLPKTDPRREIWKKIYYAARNPGPNGHLQCPVDYHPIIRPHTQTASVFFKKT